jgi:hypothetical protein
VEQSPSCGANIHSVEQETPLMEPECSLRCSQEPVTRWFQIGNDFLSSRNPSCYVNLYQLCVLSVTTLKGLFTSTVYNEFIDLDSFLLHVSAYGSHHQSGIHY